MATKNQNSAAAEAAKKALEAVKAKKEAEKTRTAGGNDTRSAGTKARVQHNITHVEQQSVGKQDLLGIMNKNAKPYRIIAVILWLLGLGFEVLAILCFKKVIPWKFIADNPGWTISWIVCLALDLILVVIGSQLWKKANHLDPASEKNKAKFWIQNNLGVIIAVVAFVPFIIFALTDKKADGKSKAIAAGVAVVLLAVGVLSGIDWNPVSQEQVLEEAGIETGEVYESVYWTKSGTVYHLYEDCGHLNNSPDLLTGTSQAAVENGKTRMCQTCQTRGVKEGLVHLPDNTDTANNDQAKDNETGSETGNENETEPVDLG